MQHRRFFTILALSFTCQTASHGAAIAGLWEFNDQSNIGQATIGTDMVFYGTAPGTWSATMLDDVGTSLSGVVTTPNGGGGEENQFRSFNNIAPNGGGIYVNEWSFLMDIFSPVSSRDSWRSLLQTNPANTNDTDFAIHPVDDSIGIGALGYSDNPYSPIDETRWTRLVVTFSIPLIGPALVRSYVNGIPLFVHDHLVDGSDGRFAIEPVVVFFGDDDGENASMNVGALALFDGTLSPTEVAALGVAGSPVPEPGTAVLLLLGGAAAFRRRRR